MSRFNAKISLTGRTHRVNISTVGDRIHLTSMPVSLWLFCSFTLNLSPCICLRLKVEKAGFLFFFNFFAGIVLRRGQERAQTPPSPQPLLCPNNAGFQGLLQFLQISLALQAPPTADSLGGCKSGAHRQVKG